MVFVLTLIHARVMLEKVFIAWLKLSIGAEGTSKFFLGFVDITFFSCIWNKEKETLTKKNIVGSENQTPKIKIQANP